MGRRQQTRLTFKGHFDALHYHKLNNPWSSPAREDLDTITARAAQGSG